MLITVLNTSTLVQNADVEIMTKAIDIQVKRDVLPAWNLANGSCAFYADAKDIPANAWVIRVIDDDTQVEGALGFHTEEAGDVIDGFVMCKPILSNGGAAYKFDTNNPGQYTVSGTLSHEILELLLDPQCNSWRDCGPNSISLEICDPVEQIGYGIEVDGVAVAVSDFVLPDYFDVENTKGPFNYLKTLTGPFEIAAGGYVVSRTGGPGSEKQIFGEKMPDWRMACKLKAFSRAGRRASQTKH